MSQSLKVEIGQYSDAGRKPVNQDFHGACNPDNGELDTKGVVLAIADGISSSQVSQIASKTAITGFIEDYYCTPESWSAQSSGMRVLKSVNAWLFAQTQASPYRFNKDKGYICTFSALVFKSTSAHIFHVGDSRIFRVEGESLEPLTQDHRQTVDEETSYLTRALGIHATLDIDYQTFPLKVGDCFVLATDGVHEFLSSKVISQAFAHSTDLDATAKQLVQNAYENGSGDNLTLILARVQQLPERQLSELQQQATLLPAPPTLSARKSFDGFDIIRELYISSRSHVFLAKDSQTGELCALKTPSTELRNNAEYLERFLIEEWIATRIDHPNVLKAFKSSRAKTALYTTMEYLEGQTLAQWQRDNPKPSVDSVRDIIAQVAKGLQAFHRKEMVHQDIRPNNIMIDRSGTVKIIDFGAVRVAGLAENVASTQEGILGTAQFSAPEYFIGQPGTHRSDIYSLGVLAYQMLTGDLPYGHHVARAHNAQLQRRLRYQPARREDIAIPDWVDFALAKSVAIEPHKRYQEVSEFIHDLSQPSTTYQRQSTPPLISRNPVLFWQVLCLLLFMVAVFEFAWIRGAW